MSLTKKCSGCQEMLPVTDFGRNRSASDGMNHRCRPCIRTESKAAYVRHRERKTAYERARYLADRGAALLLLGGKCKHCGFPDPRALQIDHIDGGGTDENRRIKPRGIIARVLAGEAGYQLLCANCNSIKRVENDETPWRRHSEAAPSE